MSHAGRLAALVRYPPRLAAIPESRPVADQEVEDATTVEPPWITILWNCDCHTFEQVVRQLQKAIACSAEEGWKIAWQVHTAGRAVVKVGPEPECVRVGNVLAAIGLIVTVAQS